MPQTRNFTPPPTLSLSLSLSLSPWPHPPRSVGRSLPRMLKMEKSSAANYPNVCPRICHFFFRLSLFLFFFFSLSLHLCLSIVFLLLPFISTFSFIFVFQYLYFSRLLVLSFLFPVHTINSVFFNEFYILGRHPYWNLMTASCFQPFFQPFVSLLP